MIVTTAPKATETMMNKAKKAVQHFSATYISREGASVRQMMDTYNEPLLICESKRLLYYDGHQNNPFFFHPNSAMFRGKGFMNTRKDPLVNALRLEEGMKVADMTLGLASDAVLASLAVGETGKVFGTEAHPIVSYIVREGLGTYETNRIELTRAMRRIEVIGDTNLNWLMELKDESIDVIYFDPMFEAEVAGSSGMIPLKQLLNKSEKRDVLSRSIKEAKRVAKHRVVLKDHFRSERFKELGFTKQIRPSATYHFGVWEKE